MKRLCLALLLVTVAAPGLAQFKLGGSADTLLEPEKAFRFSARALDDAAVEVRFAIAEGEARARKALGISPEQYTRLETARMTTEAIKLAPNLMIVPSNAILDARSLMGTTAVEKK